MLLMKASSTILMVDWLVYNEVLLVSAKATLNGIQNQQLQLLP